MKVLKTGRLDAKSKIYRPKKNALSAAWDLTILQRMSDHIPSGFQVVLVTEDNGLAKLTNHVGYRGRGLTIDDSSLDANRVVTRTRLIEACAARRMPKRDRISAPSRQLCADVVEAHEKGLGIESGVPDQLRRGPLVITPTLTIRRRDLELIRSTLMARSEGERVSTLVALRAVTEHDDCRSLLHGFIRVGALAAGGAARRGGAGVRQTLVEALPRLGEHADYGLSLLDYLERDERPIQFGARYIMFTREDQARRHMTLQAAAVWALLDKWGGEESIKFDIVNEAVSLVLGNR